MVHPLFLRDGGGSFHGRARIFHAVSVDHSFSFLKRCEDIRTSAGLYYFSAKLAPPKYAALASWITGWANITGQVTLVCSIDFTWSVMLFLAMVCVGSHNIPDSAQMITSAITVGSDGAIVLGSGATYGILLAILLCHGLVCSAATNVLARLNLFYVMVNGVSSMGFQTDVVGDVT